MIRRSFKHFVCAASTLGILGLLSMQAFAETAISGPSSAFSSVSKDDWARAWIEYLFRGTALPDGMAVFGAPFSPAAEGLRQALGLYSFGMLLVGGLLVFFHIASMVAETAHHGVVFGRRANQVWMPIRFIFAIGLLVPVSGSLNCGQYVVLKIAESGSALASNAWRLVTSVGGEHLAGLVLPHGPDVAKITATAVEMEICRSVYQQTFSTMQEDPSVRMAGNIGNMAAKIPATRFLSETWRISNLLNANAPLCGEMRFSGFRRPRFLTPAVSDAVSMIASNLATFSHEQADDLFNRAQVVAVRAAPVFLGTATPTGADVQNDLMTIEGIYRTRLDTERLAVAAAGPPIANAVLQNSADAGWLTAARFILELARLQESISSLFNHALPESQEPVLAHPVVARQLLIETLDTLPNYHPLDQESFTRLANFYGQVGRVMMQVHGWMYNSQISDKDFVSPSSFDLRDRLNAATDPVAAFSIYAQAMDAAALERGVWGVTSDSGDMGYPFTPLAANAVYNPFAALIEFGQRQVDFATALAGIAGSGIVSAGTAGPAALLGIAALAFLLGGLLLVFVVPFLPFLRFFISALAWVVVVFEAVVAIPIVALAHLSPVGEGLSGAMARQAYMLWLGLFVRPLLTLLGFVLGLLVFVLSITFLNVMLAPFAQMSMPANDGLLTIANAGLVLLYDVLVFAAVNASFKGIHWLPEKALRWVSNFVMTDGTNIPVPSNSGGPAPGGYSTQVFVSGGGGSASSSAIGYGLTGGGGSPASTSGQGHAAKTALFPQYSDKSDAVKGPLTIPGASPTSSTATSSQGGATNKTFIDQRKPRPSTREELDNGLKPKDGERPMEKPKDPDAKDGGPKDGGDKPK